MTDLKTVDKQILERLFQMRSGYVLDFSDRTIGDFFKDELIINFFDEKYNYASGSKANRMRGFWRVADNKLVAQTILKLIEYIESKILLNDFNKEDFQKEHIEAAKNIARKLTGDKNNKNILSSEEVFLKREFKEIDLDKLGFDSVITNILDQRLKEIERNINANSPLSAIFLAGSTLEGILFGIADSNLQKFNSAKSAPKDTDGNVKKFNEWTLGNYIDVSKEMGFIKEDVKKFSHVLRDFRNYIHPYHQMNKKFNPDKKTATICWKVLELVIDQISNKK